MTLAGGNKKGGKHAYYCAAHKAMGPARCVGMKGIHRVVVEEFALSGLRDGLMQPAAYAQFRDDLTKHMRASQSASLEQVAALDKRIRTLEKARTNLLNAIKSGAIVEDLADDLNKVGADLKAARAQRAEAEVAPVELPENLPQLYRAHIDDLTATLSDGSVSDAAADALRDLIARIVVHYDKASDTHRIELEGKIVQLLEAGSPNAKSPTGGGAYAGWRSSLELVAGAGYRRQLPAPYCLV